MRLSFGLIAKYTAWVEPNDNAKGDHAKGCHAM